MRVKKTAFGRFSFGAAMRRGIDKFTASIQRNQPSNQSVRTKSTMRTWPVQDAKARFSELLDACLAEGPQMLTRRGTETAKEAWVQHACKCLSSAA